MGAEQGNEGPELMPAGLEFLPLVAIGRIIVFSHRGEATDVHSPKRNTAHREIKAGRHLSLHVCP